MDQSTANALITTVRSAYAAALAEAQSVSDSDQQKTSLKAMEMEKAAIDDWAGPQLAQVQAGTRTEQNWTDYGQNVLLVQLNRFATDLSSFYAQYSAAILSPVVDIESTIDSALTAVSNELSTWQGDLANYQAQLATVDSVAAQLAPVKSQLTAAQQDLLYGSSRQMAGTVLSWLATALDTVQNFINAGSTALTSKNGDIVMGNAPVANTDAGSTDDEGNFDPGVMPDLLPQSGLGDVVPWEAAGAATAIIFAGTAEIGTAGLLALAAGIAAAVYLLNTYFGQTGQALTDLGPTVAALKAAGLTPEQISSAVAGLGKGGGGSGTGGWALVKDAAPWIAGGFAVLVVISLTTNVLTGAINSITNALMPRSSGGGGGGGGSRSRRKNPRKRARRRLRA